MARLWLAYTRRTTQPTQAHTRAIAPDTAARQRHAVLRAPRRWAGVAVLPQPDSTRTRVFVCDDEDHSIRVFDSTGAQLAAFGGPGAGPGLFAHPADVALVRPQMPHEPSDAGSIEPYLAVADRFNHRVQILTTDGAPVGCIGGREAPPRAHPTSPDPGWPFFRLTEHPVLDEPCELSWRDPWLEVTCASGRIARVDLALALLPSLEEWLQSAGAAERARAARYFELSRFRKRALPEAVYLTVIGRTRDAAA